jgi:hypothetical protein
MTIMDIFDDRQNRLLWRTALIIYEVMRGQDDVDRVSTVAHAWDYLTSDGNEMFPPLLMEPAQRAVTQRLVRIAYRAVHGRALCPELEGPDPELDV